MKKDKTFLIFGTSPFLNTIKDKIPILIEKHHTIGINYPLFNYEYLAFADCQAFNEYLKQYKLIIPYYLESALKTTYEGGHSIIGNEWVQKPEYISKNDFNLSLLLAVEFAIFKGAEKIVLIASELKTDKHAHNEVIFSLKESVLKETNNVLKASKVPIYQTNKDSNLDLPFISIESLV